MGDEDGDVIGEPVGSFCVYCGADEKINVELGNTTLQAKSSLADKIIEAASGDLMYWLIVCPACGTIVRVIYKETVFD